MRNFLLASLFILAAFTDSCATRHKDSEPEIKAQENKAQEGGAIAPDATPGIVDEIVASTRPIVDVSTVTNPPTETLVKQKVCTNDEIMRLDVEVPNNVPYDRFEATLCLKDNSSHCLPPTSFTESSILIDAPDPGIYKVSVKGCFDPEHSTQPCGPVGADQTFEFKPESTQTKIILQTQSKLRDKTTELCKKIRKEMQTYLEAETDPNAKLVPIIKTHLAYTGIDTCRAMLLSPDLAFLENLSQSKPVSVETPAADPAQTRNTNTIVYQRNGSAILGITYIFAGSAGVFLGGYYAMSAYKSVISEKVKVLAKSILTLEQEHRALEAESLRLEVQDYKGILDIAKTHNVENFKDWKPTELDQEIKKVVNELGEQWYGRSDLGDFFDPSKELYASQSEKDLIESLSEINRSNPVTEEKKVPGKGWGIWFKENGALFVNSFIDEKHMPFAKEIAGYFNQSWIDINAVDKLPFNRFNELMKHRQSLSWYQKNLGSENKSFVEMTSELEKMKSDAEFKLSRVNDEWKNELKSLFNAGKSRVYSKTRMYGLLGLFGGSAGGYMLGNIFGAAKYGAIGGLVGAVAAGGYQTVEEFINAYEIHSPSLRVKQMTDAERKARYKQIKLEVEKKVAQKAEEEQRFRSTEKGKSAARAAAAPGLIIAALGTLGVVAGASQFALTATPQSQFLSNYSKLYAEGTSIEEQYNANIANLVTDSCSK